MNSNIRMTGLTLSVLMGVLLAAVASRADANEYFTDGFETYPAGGYPGGGWQMRYNAVSDPANNKVVDTVAYAGNQSLQLYGRHSGCWGAAAYLDLPECAEPFYASAVVRAGDEAGGGCHDMEVGITLGYQISPGGYSTDSEGLWFKADKSIVASWGAPSTTFAQDLTFTSFEWYRVQIGVLPAYRRFFYTIDGRYVGSTNVPDERWPDEHFVFGLGSGDGIGWADDVSVGTFGPEGRYLEPLTYLTHEIAEVLPSCPCAWGQPMPFSIIPAAVQEIYDDAGVPISAALAEQITRFQDEKKWIGALSDVELKIIDPLGRWVDATGGTLPGADYFTGDLDGDGDNEVCVLLDASEYLMGQYTVQVMNPDPGSPETYSLFHYDPAGELLLPIITDGILTAGGSATHLFTAIPEPGTILLLGAGVLSLLGFIRRRRPTSD